MFCERVFTRLRDRVRLWCTINEPTVFASMGYVLGEFPPGVRSMRRCRGVSLNLMRAHARCYRHLKSIDDSAQIGLVKNINLFDAYRWWNPLHRFMARLLDGWFNRCWLNGLRTGRFKPPSSLRSHRIEGLKGSSDFIGLNYYTHLLATPFMPTKVEIDPLIRPWQTRTDFRYPMYAEGFGRAIDMVGRLGLPIHITENGVADHDDDVRPEHVRRHLLVMMEKMAEHDIRGFYNWSLMDNFEWADGYSQCFGLHHVDYATQTRTLRHSGEVYRDIARRHRLPQAVILAGGLGTRLGALGERTPKALLPVAGRPMLSHILDHLQGQGVDRVVVLTGHLGEAFEPFSHPGIDLTFVRETKPLGTGGALWNARDQLEESFLLLWGDDFHPLDLEALRQAHAGGITMTVTEAHTEMNLQHEGGMVTHYDKANPSGNGYEAGTSVVDREVLLEHGREGRWSWEQTVYPAMAGRIRAHLDDTPFFDIGTPERLALFEAWAVDRAGD